VTASETAESVLQQIRELAGRARADVAAAASVAELEEIERRTLGKRGWLAAMRKTIGSFSADDRRTVGAAFNTATAELEDAVQQRNRELTAAGPAPGPSFDVTRPGVSHLSGGLHPTIQMMYDINDAFEALNFEIYEGPEISSELYEFDHMNFPPDHPARESMDTFWITETVDKRGEERLCLRPHLTGASVRYMQENDPPLRFAYPGRVYRNENPDARHERAFFQYEALIVDREVPFSSGKLLVDTILNTVFGHPVSTRMRAGFFPFVEPGFEIDMQCLVCGGRGCRLCKQIGWLEVMPGGVPHPNVLRAGGIDPDEWMGFYINVGLDRLVMMRYGIDDVRLFHGGELRFLNQFK
jgi:phenylalanyl-tRNA synthetase alpha chain